MPVFKIEIDVVLVAFSMMSTVILSDYHKVIVVGVVQVTGEGQFEWLVG